MTAGQLRKWIDLAQAEGLTREAENLVILAFAEQTGRTFRRHGGPFQPALASLPDDVELCEEHLPGEPAWEAAVDRAGSISARLLCRC